MPQVALKKIQKYRNSVGIKPWSLQELQPRIWRIFEVESSKLLAYILKFAGIKPKNLQKLQQTIYQWSSTDSSPKSSEEFLPQTFEYEEHSKRNHPNHLPRSQNSLELNLKAFKTPRNHKLVKLYGFKPPKPWRVSTINFKRRRMHEELEEREEQKISDKLIARDSLKFCFKDLRSIPQTNWRIFDVRVKITLPQFQSISLSRRSNQRITLL